MSILTKLLNKNAIINFLTLLGLVLFVYLQDTISFWQLLPVILAIGLQNAIALYPLVERAAVPVEHMIHTKAFLPRFIKRIPQILILTPILLFIDLMLSYVFVLTAILLTSYYFAYLALRLIQRKQLKGESLKLLKKTNPKVAIYISGLEGVAYQVNQWLPVLEKMAIPAIIIVREKSIYKGMKPTPIPTFYARAQIDVETLISNAPTLKTVLYPANTMKNVQALRFYHLNHYFINHGESDKAVNQSKLLMAYDKLLVGGPLAEKRLREAGLPIRDGQIEHVGRPQAELFLEQIEQPQPIKTLLYAPTWEGFVDNVNYSSINELGYDMVKTIINTQKYKLIFKPHPYTGRKQAKNAQYLKRILQLCKENNVDIHLPDSSAELHDLMNQSDALITDISSVLNEYLITNKPIILCNTKHYPLEEMNQEFPSTQAAYVLNDGKEIDKLLTTIDQQDTMQAIRYAIRTASLCDFKDSAFDQFTRVIKLDLAE
ncbi:CDP-glycerol:poly(glycerophosphate) glycerophosphotransferase [Thiomicrospira cyclica ALM1]|uniref:CDP-glycerol:poly(Glycerophosphate) glycerophosphotransferase n=1 Tax=Thiomicrospira cyclica (strain DSM 14477 / JCM 11371 / ALM1) TaxID=717773 RepID=F6DCW2_THICA|nr:CDP-glycerol:poly(glycerophosphate) glycerophosphotransferase [Thiomicrospira cyclica ALM1]